MAAAVAVVVVAGFALSPVPAALADGPGQLSIAITPIDVSDNSTITQIADGQHNNRITYNVQYSCTTDVCEDTELQFSPSQPDPHGILPADRYLLEYESWVGPDDATISGTNATGKRVVLGDLDPGESGSFRLTYTITGDRHRDVPWGSFYPDGFEIAMSVTGTSPTITADAVGTASPVTWRIAVPGGANPAAGPAVGISAPASVDTDTPTDFNLTFAGGNMFYGSGANVTGDAAMSAVGSYTVVYTAPPEAVIAAAQHGGVIDPVANTVTWTVGSASEPVYAARGGWGLNLVSGYNGSGAGTANPAGSTIGDDLYALWRFRAVTLEFPGENFPASDENGCNFATTVSSSISATVRYLDGANTTKTVSATRNNQVACWDPFGGINVNKHVYGGAGNQYGQGDGAIGSVYAANVPAPGAADRTALYWRVGVANRGNVPGVAIIDEPDLSLDDAPVYQIWPTGVGAVVEWVRSDGEEGTTTLAVNQTLTAPGTTYFTSVRATTATIAPGRIQKTDTTETWAYMNYRMRISDSAPIGEQRTNTASVTMTYPDHPGLEIIPLALEQDVPRTIRFTQASPQLGAAFTGAPVVAGGGPLTPGTEVTYSMNGFTNVVWPGTQIRPQLVFVAPVGWDVVDGSAAVAGAPPGMTFSRETKTIGGASRSVLVATWPENITPSTTGTDTWPTLTVRATPTASAPTATNAAVALVWAGDASGTYVDAISAAYITNTNQFRAYGTAVVDTSDVDDDGNTTEEFAQGPASAALTVAAPTAMQVVKELCVPTGEPGGCDWVSDALQAHHVPVDADDITYRIRISNPSPAALTEIVAYDVLPHVGDTGLLPGATARGSEFDLALSSVLSVSPGVTVSYSGSTNPTRPEVYAAAPGAVDDWGPDPAGASALRMSIPSLAAGSSVEVVFTAEVQGSPVADQQACNTVAVDSAQSLPAEPLAVCVALAEADLSVELTTFENLQAGRPTTIGYTVTNHGGSALAPASVQVEIPEGITVTSLSVSGWACTVVGGGAVPLAGEATLTCSPVDALGDARELALDDPEVLSFPVVVDVEEGTLCTSAEVSGDLFDPVAANNSAGECAEVAPPPAGLVITKDDDQAATWIGAEYAYTITVTNTLLAEAVNGAVVTDTLPASLEFVSADNGGTAAGQTVTWNLAGLAPEESVDLEVVVRVLGTATSPLVNTASVSAPDPGFDGETLTDSDSDTNDVLTLAIAKTSNARESGVREGDVVTYTVTVSGDPDGAFPEVTITDDLSGVLDEATFVDGSATVSVDGATPTALDDPVGGLLTWTGGIPADADVVITYRVAVGEAADGELVNAVSAAGEPSECDPETGRDEDGVACAVVSIPFAPTITKSVDEFSHGDDGTWTIVYLIEVLNPAPVDAVYDLADALAFGPEITVESTGIDGPLGVDLEDWEESGALALEAELPAGAEHEYLVTVVADAGTTAGTAAAECAAGQPLGFANTAVLTLSDDTELTAEACAEPVEPSVAKELDGEPVQSADGTWTVSYLVTVGNDAEEPDGGLAYRLEDALAFPDGIDVEEIVVTAPDGVTANSGFTGGLTEIGGATLTADEDLVDGVARIPAPTGDAPVEHVYRVDVVVTAAEGSVDADLLACGAPGAGYGNWITLLAGETALGSDTACADIRLPELEFTKTVDTSGGARSGDVVDYTIVLTNVGDADFTEGDPAAIVDDMSDLLDDARYLDDAAAPSGSIVVTTPTLTWTGALPAGETIRITYSVRLAPAGDGDGSILNQVRRAGISPEPGDVAACADTPAGNDGASACDVEFQLDTRALGDTGAAAPLGALAMALAALAAGALLVRRRRTAA